MADGGAAISGISCQNRGQSIDSVGGSLFNPNRGCEYHMAGAIYTHPWSGGQVGESGPDIAAVRVWMAALGEWRMAGP